MKSSAAGDVRISTRVASLVDTDVLVYVFDRQDPRKQRIASDLLDRGVRDRSLRVAHQSLIEFVSVVTRRRGGAAPLLQPPEAWRETEEMLTIFEILYPNEAVVRTALRGAALYKLPWYDAHLWAFAEHYGISEIISEDFTHGRRYGTVKIVNPFL
jgi:predicted nucleic acid-binding protein